MSKKDDTEVRKAVEDIRKEQKDPQAEKIAELTDDLKRVQAEFENYKKRVEKENVRVCLNNRAELIKRLLPVIDSFEIALKSSEKHPEFMKGFELIYAQLYSVLREEGLWPIDTKGRKFDPYLHEVLLSEVSDLPEGTIIEELQKGYRLNDCVIRHSKVKIAKKREDGC